MCGVFLAKTRSAFDYTYIAKACICLLNAPTCLLPAFLTHAQVRDGRAQAVRRSDAGDLPLHDVDVCLVCVFGVRRLRGGHSLLPARRAALLVAATLRWSAALLPHRSGLPRRPARPPTSPSNTAHNKDGIRALFLIQSKHCRRGERTSRQFCLPQ